MEEELDRWLKRIVGTMLQEPKKGQKQKLGQNNKYSVLHNALEYLKTLEDNLNNNLKDRQY